MKTPSISCRSLTASAMLIALSFLGIDTAFADWSKSENAEFNRYFNGQPALARSYEQRGDAAAAAGNRSEALDDYCLALEYVAYAPYYMLHLDQVATVKRGIRLVGLVPADLMYQAGARDGDVLTAIDGKAIAGMPRVKVSELMLDQARVMQTPGNAFRPSTFSLLRGDTPLDVTPTMAEFNTWVTDDNRADTQRLLDKQVAIYASMTERPPIPAPARAAAAKAQDIAHAASDAAALKNAAAEFLKASLIAPWWSDLYVNYALFQKASNDAVGAHRSLTAYLSLDPASEDAPAVRQMLAELEPDAAAQRKLDDWTGWWALSINGVRQNSGMRIERQGTMLFVRNSDTVQPWLRATIVDDNTAKDFQRYSSDTGSVMREPWATAIRKCFNGAYESSGTLTLSPDRKQLMAVNQSLPTIDLSNCAMTQTGSETLRWVR